MFSGMLQAGTKALGGARFSLVNLMPAALFVTTMAILIASGAYTGRKPSLTHLFHEIDKNPGWAIAGAFGIFLIAVLLRPFQVALVQFLEGYWQNWRPLGLADDIATERHRRLLHTARVVGAATGPRRPASGEFSDVADYARRRRKFLKIQGRANLIADRYPRTVDEDDRLMPTLLGNVLRDAEDHAAGRYGLQFNVYPRMYPSLSPKLDSAISAQLDVLDTTSALCIVFALIALFALPLLAHLNWWDLVPPAALVASVLAYRGALSTASRHGTLLATAFDLHRFDMLTALHYELPPTPEEELKLNVELSGFLDGRNDVMVMKKFRYLHPAAPVLQSAQPSEPSPAANDVPGNQ